MPELPEVETVCRGLAPALVQRRIVRVNQRRPDLRIPFPVGFTQRLSGRKVLSLTRRAKYILVHIEGDLTLIIHLGMSGRITIHPPFETAISPGRFHHNVGKARAPREWGPHDHVIFELDDGTLIVYSDHRRFGLMTLAQTGELNSHALLANVGVEPLGSQLTPEFLSAKLKDKKSPIKASLLDQRIIAGLGNIYVCEALFYAGISPRRQSGTVPGARAKRLVDAIGQVLRAAIQAGGSSLRDYAHADGELGYFQHQFAVYDREGETCKAPRCDNTIQRIVQSGRSTFFCSKCQR